jgi:hypothetical protein
VDGETAVAGLAVPAGRHGGPVNAEDLRSVLGRLIRDRISGYAAIVRLYRFSTAPLQVGFSVEPAGDAAGAPIAVLVAEGVLQLEIGRAGAVRIELADDADLCSEVGHWLRGVLDHRVTETIWYHRGRIAAATLVIDPEWSRVTATYTTGVLARLRADHRERHEYRPYRRVLPAPADQPP